MNPSATPVLFHGGRLATLDEGHDDAEALAVVDGRIAAIGSRQEAEDAVSATTGGEAVPVDLADGVLAPAFVDHHVHLLNVGMSLLHGSGLEGPDRAPAADAVDRPAPVLDLSGCGSAEEVVALVESRARERPRGSWIIGKGWNQERWPERTLPHHRLLSREIPDHPVYLARVDAHSGWCNAAALEAAGIDADSPDPPGGAILRDADGEPTGILLERACEPVLERLPRRRDDEIVSAFRSAARALAARGVTRVFDAGFLEVPSTVSLTAELERYLDLLVRADRAEPLPVDVGLMVIGPSRLADRVLEDPEGYRRLTPRIGVTHLKLYADGAFGSRGAALRRPYTDDPESRGVPRMDRREIVSAAGRALDGDLDVAVHAIGDAAVGDVLDAFETLLDERPSLSPGRLRIEHFSTASRSDHERAARLGVLLVVQPAFIEPDADGTTMEDRRLGPERIVGTYAFRDLLRDGARLAGSSDHFGNLLPPLAHVHVAATRRNRSGRPADGWRPDQRLDRRRAIRLFTRRYPPGGDPEGGRLRVGAPADLAVLTADPRAVDDEELLAVRVASTWRRGRRVFDRARAPQSSS